MLGNLSGWQLLMIAFVFLIVVAVIVGVVLAVVYTVRRGAVTCPHCRSRINREATVCPQCRREISLTSEGNTTPNPPRATG